jgi:multicomponent Na+:H+ antiporter subunit E
MRLLTAVLLFVLWLSLSATFDVAHLVAGAAVAGLVAWLNPALPHVQRLSWIPVLLYQPWLFGRVLRSGLHVSRLILDPSLPISPGLVQHRTRLKGDGELVVLGNSITLTPGTITVEVAPGELLVHAIDKPSTADLLSGTLDSRVSQVFTGKESVR